MRATRFGYALVAILLAISTSSLLAQQPQAPAGGPAAAGQGAPGRGAAPAGGIPGGGRGAPVVIGPPAPVPPQVAMLRPTPAELEQMNAALKSLIASDKSAAAPLLKKYESLMLQPPRLNTAATFTQTQQRMGPRHEGFVATAKQGNIDLLLHGDSITDWWLQDANKPMFDKYFGSIRTANFAVAGDTTQGVLWGLKNGEGQGFQPKAVMLMIGTNNIGRQHARPKSRKGSAPSFSRCGKDFPNAKILLLAIFPRSVPGDPVRDRIAEVNRIISKLDDQQERLLPGHRGEVPRREGRVPARFVPRRQPASAGQGLRHLGRRPSVRSSRS